MKMHFVHRGKLVLLVIFVASHITLSGCGDDSRTTGTMIQVSAEEKARIKAKAETYKGGPHKKKSKAASRKH
jgi:hypothetical protein